MRMAEKMTVKAREPPRRRDDPVCNRGWLAGEGESPRPLLRRAGGLLDGEEMVYAALLGATQVIEKDRNAARVAAGPEAVIAAYLIRQLL
jgi:hypothetical protein